MNLTANAPSGSAIHHEGFPFRINTKDTIRSAYDKAAQRYAAELWDELDGKPFDRQMLRWFAEHVPAGETILEIGAGPGEVSAFLSRLGATCLATDLSPEMVETGRQCCPELAFEVQDFFNLTYAQSSFSAVLAFYAIVNLRLEEIPAMLAETYRVLKPGGLFFLSFHVREAEDAVHVAKFFSEDDNPLTFYYFTVDEIRLLLIEAGFILNEVLLRYPYEGAEYPSKRADIIVQKAR